MVFEWTRIRHGLKAVLHKAVMLSWIQPMCLVGMRRSTTLIQPTSLDNRACNLLCGDEP
jgi:hypothetical protein